MLRLLISVTIMLAAGLVAFAQTLVYLRSLYRTAGCSGRRATITIKSNSTGAEFKVVTSGSGSTMCPQLFGLYTVTIGATGFKKAVVQDVKL
ncbi:MAG: carboxypeptidase regulatory-like domain-containing protein [Acidobacteria bacterium]|nr:carboxypeptidase regulatory-like domain-containing protein [Acidobacteriota bacterium]